MLRQDRKMKTQSRTTQFALCAAASVVCLLALYISYRVDARVRTLRAPIAILQEASQTSLSFDRQHPKLGRIRFSANSEVGAGLRSVILSLKAEQAAWLWSGIPAGSGPARVLFVNAPGGEELRFIFEGGRIEFNGTVIPLTATQYEAFGALTSRTDGVVMK